MFRNHQIVYEAMRYGYRVKNYTLLERIGEGGEADIWSAWDSSKARVVAIRMIPRPEVGAGVESGIPSDVQRQVELLSKIDHPNVLPHYEFGAEEHFYYIAMRYCPVGSLADRILAGPISLEDVLKYTAQITSALDYLHQRNIVHRDINPSNLLLDGQGRVYLADFGLAKLFVQDTLPMHTGRGTEIYAPFEQFARYEVVPQSDIYSMGITIFEMLTGRLPWMDMGILASTPGEQTLSIPDLLTYNSELPSELTDALRHLTAYYWDQRPASAKIAYELLVEASGLNGDLELAEYQDLPKLDEEILILGDAQFLLEKFLTLFDPETDQFPARLTHFAVIDSACSPGKVHHLDLSAQLGRFMLHGALAHNYHVDEWWQRLRQGEDCFAVCGQIIANESEATAGRALTQLLGEGDQIDLPESLRPVVLERLVDLAADAMSWSLRSKALQALLRIIQKAEHWQPIGVTTQSDYKLANLALADSSMSAEAARLIGWMRSESAVKVIIESQSGVDSRRSLEVLGEIADQAGSLPDCVPVGVRLKVFGRRARVKWLSELRESSIPHLLIGLSAGLLVTFMMVWGVFSQINVRMRDSMYEPYPVSNVLTIVEVGDEDLAYYGRWDSWPRSLHAALIDRLSQAGARAILIDFVFAAETADDPLLAEAMRQAGIVVQPVLGQESANMEGAGAPRYPDSVAPNMGLLNESVMVGHTNIIHDEDGYVRKAPTMIQVNEQQFMSLAMAAIQVFVGAEATMPLQAKDGILEFAGRQIPVDDNGALFIHYAGPPAVRDAKTYQMVNYRAVIENEVPEELIKDKMILVGITATGGKDFFLTPVSDGRPMAGIEILANTIETIWSSRFISLPAEGVRILVLLCLGALVGLVSRHLWSGLAFTVIVALVYFLLASWLFDSAGVLLDLFYPFLVMLISFMLTIIYRQTIGQV